MSAIASDAILMILECGSSVYYVGEYTYQVLGFSLRLDTHY
jgi:hypothetical protein